MAESKTSSGSHDESLTEILAKLDKAHELYSDVATNAAPYLVNEAYQATVSKHGLDIKRPKMGDPEKEHLIEGIVDRMKEKALVLLGLIKGEQYVAQLKQGISDEAWDTILLNYFGINKSGLRDFLKNLNYLGQGAKDQLAQTIGNRIQASYRGLVEAHLKNEHIETGKTKLAEIIKGFGGDPDQVTKNVYTRQELAQALTQAYQQKRATSRYGEGG